MRCAINVRFNFIYTIWIITNKIGTRPFHPKSTVLIWNTQRFTESKIVYFKYHSFIALPVNHLMYILIWNSCTNNMNFDPFSAVGIDVTGTKTINYFYANILTDVLINLVLRFINQNLNFSRVTSVCHLWMLNIWKCVHYWINSFLMVFLTRRRSMGQYRTFF